MKTAFTFLFIGLMILIFLYSKGDIFFTKSTVDIHLHDTYYVIANFHSILVLVLFLGTLFLIGGVFGTRFRNKYFLISALAILFADAYLIFQIAQFF